MKFLNKIQAKYKISAGKWIIKDWADNDVFGGGEFDSSDDAEEFLSEKLGDKYDTDREEYYVQEK